MSAQATQSVPIACVSSAIPREARAAHFSLAKHLFTELAEAREPLTEGYAFRFLPDAITLIAQFVDKERRCCPLCNSRFQCCLFLAAFGCGCVGPKALAPSSTRNSA